MTISVESPVKSARVATPHFMWRTVVNYRRATGGRLVAIRDEEVVADAETYFQLHKILCARFGGLVYAYIEKVTPQSFEEWGDEPAVIIGFFAARAF